MQKPKDEVMDEVNGLLGKKEPAPLDNPIIELENKEAFLKDYKALVEKHGYDFYQSPAPPVQVIKLSFPPKP